MKKKVLSVFLVVALIAITAMGTLAYFTDVDNATNVFTVGKVDITLIDEFEQESKLFPGVDVSKVVNVSVEEGSEDTYVRVHIAIPSMLDSGSEDEPQYVAYNNTLHFNMAKASYADGLWNWNKSVDGPNYPDDGGDWNEYQTTIGGILYNVYVVTYETALSAGESGDEAAMFKVYLDKKVTNEQVTGIKAVLGENWKIPVVAEGAQAAGFDNAYDALNTAFGTPGSYNPFT